ncbi:MAG TPA: hypothetical protein VF622_15765 [Segetibacter sp.]|jgi:hypothetical protein
MNIISDIIINDLCLIGVADLQRTKMLHADQLGLPFVSEVENCLVFINTR